MSDIARGMKQFRTLRFTKTGQEPEIALVGPLFVLPVEPQRRFAEREAIEVARDHALERIERDMTSGGLGCAGNPSSFCEPCSKKISAAGESIAPSRMVARQWTGDAGHAGLDRCRPMD